MTLLPHPVTGQRHASPVPPGTGWPDDLATSETLVARSPGGVRRLAARADLDALSARVSVCRACPRLVAWREQHAVVKKREFADQPYWGRPAPGFGDPEARVLLVGLAPAAHGANRTGRTFTGDRSGDWLARALHAAGLADLPTSEHAGDGQRLRGVRMVATVRCAPPDNRPSPEERATCAPWLEREVALLREHLRVVVCLGAVGWEATWRLLAPGERRPAFGHGVEARAGDLVVIGSFHPSPLNTQTGRLSADMLTGVLRRAAGLAGL